jgi:hypothetical protein
LEPEHFGDCGTEELVLDIETLQKSTLKEVKNFILSQKQLQRDGMHPHQSMENRKNIDPGGSMRIPAPPGRACGFQYDTGTVFNSVQNAVVGKNS